MEIDGEIFGNLQTTNFVWFVKPVLHWV